MVSSTVASLASFQRSKTNNCGFNVPMDIGKRRLFSSSWKKVLWMSLSCTTALLLSFCSLEIQGNMFHVEKNGRAFLM